MIFLNIIVDWLEVWALLIPLAVLIVCKPREKYIRPLAWYIVSGLLLNLAATLMLEYYYLVPKWLYVDGMANNNILYNIHSIIRVLFLSWFIISVRQYQFPAILKIVVGAYLVFIIVDFLFLESPFYLGTTLFAGESITLLILCFSYFFSSIRDESETNWLKHPSFLTCAGVALYEVLTFFVFLFFYPLSDADHSFFTVTMRIYSIAFLLFCILLALTFYQVKRQSKNPGLANH